MIGGFEDKQKPANADAPRRSPRVDRPAGPAQPEQTKAAQPGPVAGAQKRRREKSLPPMRPSVAPAVGEQRPLSALIKGEERSAFAITSAFLVFLFAWSGLAPLSSAAIAPGVISPDSSRKTIQHFEGGIIKDILVRDGTEVRAGEVLVRLDDTMAETSYQVVRNQYITLLARQARLRALQAGTEGMKLPPGVIEAAKEESVAEILRAQRDLLANERRAYVERQGILNQRIRQLNEEIKGLERQVAGHTQQIVLIRQELESVEKLLAQGFETVTRKLSLQRAEAELTGERGEKMAEIARAQQSIGEAELQLAATRTELQEDTARRLDELQTQISETSERLAQAEDVLKRVEIRAPVSGTVVALQVHTAGGVIASGEALMDIVPAEDDLLIDVRVSPTDIDVVHEGLLAQVHLTAFGQRNLPQIEGIVRHVSADRLTDPATGEAYFKAQVEVEKAVLEAVSQRAGDDLELMSGMPAEVVIVTGEKTLIGYLTDPITDLLRRSFREG